MTPEIKELFDDAERNLSSVNTNIARARRGNKDLERLVGEEVERRVQEGIEARLAEQATLTKPAEPSLGEVKGVAHGIQFVGSD